MQDIKQLIEEEALIWIKIFLNLDYTDEQILADGYFAKLIEAYIQGRKVTLSLFRWRKVGEELPTPDDGELLLKSESDFFFGIYSSTHKGFISHETFFTTDEITHWMPIPEVKE
ncbi:MAG: hypothetical protein ACK5MK_00365 [Dysgonomonas sp.]